jgi:hypothetical protein
MSSLGEHFLLSLAFLRQVRWPEPKKGAEAAENEFQRPCKNDWSKTGT